MLGPMQDRDKMLNMQHDVPTKIATICHNKMLVQLGVIANLEHTLHKNN